jgi:hypothetical protein
LGVSGHSDEFDHLKSHFAASSGGSWGGRRKLPWVFTEHGVVMAASILRSQQPTSIMHMVVEVFVRVRRADVGLILANPQMLSSVPGSFSRRVQRALERVMDAMVDQNNQRTVRDEATEVLHKSIGHIKAKLDKAEFENQEIAASAAALLSEVEANKACAAKTLAEAEAIDLRTLANKLRLVLQAEQAFASGEMGSFMEVLAHLGKA